MEGGRVLTQGAYILEEGKQNHVYAYKCLSIQPKTV
jgi:hypothetical protein